MFFTNLESKKIYELTGNEGSTIYLERLYDGFAVTIDILNFSTKYRELSPSELMKFAELPTTFRDQHQVVTIEHLNNPTQQANVKEVGKLVEPDAAYHTFDKLIVTPKIKDQIEMGLNQIMNADRLETDWGLSEIEPIKGRCILNMVGPPGTGKTMSAKCIAQKLGKKLYQVDYSEIISKYVGDTAKHIKAAFTAAKHHNAILFFDEADSLMSKRLEVPEDGASNSINQNRNVLMQELDKYDGVMITATNFFKNYDEALLRRISMHIHFELPDEDARFKLIDQHIPSKAKARMEEGISIKALAKLTEGFSGGDILVMCSNAIKQAFSESLKTGEEGKLKQQYLMDQVNNIRKNKLSHGFKRKKISLTPGDGT